jgi:hypothetical protein
MNDLPQAKTPTQDQRQTAAQKLKDAETVHEELNTVLREQGIVLPSLRVDPLSYGDHDPKPLIDLGRCTPQTARQMIEVFRKTQP